MTIKSKIILFALILTILLNAVYLFLYLVTEKSFEHYHSILNRYLLLNNISNQTNEAFKNLELYTQNPSSAHLEEYSKSSQELMASQSQLFAVLNETANSYTLKNLYQTINSFFDEGEKVIEGVESSNVSMYATHLQEAIKISEYIHLRTQNLIEQELNNYNSFYRRLIERQEILKVFKNSVFVTTGLFSIIFALSFSREINRPLHRLVKAAKQIGKGEFNIPDVTLSSKNDEIYILTKTFNQMKQNISRYIDELETKNELEKEVHIQELKNLEYQHLLQQMELRTLQSQINPHFLFNVLNSISKLSYIEGAEKTSELIDSVSKLLRYNLQQLDQPVKLKDEIANVEEYLYILKARFRERIQYEINISEELLDFNIPNLTIQPMVENAFIHGIDIKEEGGKIQINGYKEQENVIIEIIDNGVGMDQLTIEKVLSKKPYELNTEISKRSLEADTKSHSTGLGIANVIRRLQLYYGHDNVISIESTILQGTIVKLILGPKKEGVSYD